MLKIAITATDHPDFINSIERILRNKIIKWTPSDVYLTRIDNWFDDKWRLFSGTIMHEISIHRLVEVTVPPFHPNRVERCELFTRQNEGYQKQEIKKPLHIFQASTNNLARKISDFSDNGMFIWYSGNTITNNKGSLMGYFVTGGECFTFYLTLTSGKHWKADKTIGLTAKDIEAILDTE